MMSRKPEFGIAVGCVSLVAVVVLFAPIEIIKDLKVILVGVAILSLGVFSGLCFFKAPKPKRK